MSRRPEHASNIFADIPGHLAEELLEVIAQRGNIRIERIVSQGHASPESGWYDQDQPEWVIVLQGEAVIAYATGEEVRLTAGDHVDIPAHVRHKVKWTAPGIQTVWLAVFY